MTNVSLRSRVWLAAFAAILLATADVVISLPVATMAASSTEPAGSPDGGQCVGSLATTSAGSNMEAAVAPSDEVTSVQPVPEVTEDEPSYLRLGGSWRRLPKSPFASIGAAGAWTGAEMLVVDGPTRRAASYDPVSDSWTSESPSPRRFERGAPAVWTGAELVVFGSESDVPFALAFSPSNGQWRELPNPPVSEVEDAAWTDGRVVVASRDLHSAAFDVAGDCWELLPEIPGNGRLTALYSAGRSVVAVSLDDDGDEPAQMAAFDSSTASWTLGDAAPSLDFAVEHGLWTDGRLIFLSQSATDLAPSTGASYDPADGTWTPMNAGCPISTRQAAWTGTLVINGYEGLGYDPHSNQCYRIPRHDDRHRRDPVTVWTGSSLIHWSGGRGEELNGKPDGVRFDLSVEATTERD